MPLPGFVCDAACALVLGARSGSGAAGATDHHWVDNLRMSGPPGRPAPPVLVSATAPSLLLAWFAPHHGGEEVLLYWLVLTPTPIRTLALTLTTEPKQVLLYRLRMWRGTRWLNLYVGARANHTVHYLEQGTAHLFRLQATLAPSLATTPTRMHPLVITLMQRAPLPPTHLSHPPLPPTSVTHPSHPPIPTHTHPHRMQAYNANGWGASSPSASFATVTWPLASHAAPPRVPRVNAGSCVCGGKLYVAGGQSVGSGGGVGGPVRTDIAQPGPHMPPPPRIMLHPPYQVCAQLP